MVEDGVLEDIMEVKVIMLNDEMPDDETTDEAVEFRLVAELEIIEENIVVMDPLEMVEGAELARETEDVDDIVAFDGMAEETMAT